MKKLLKTYNLKTREQYFDLIIESVINGQRTQAKAQFKTMPKYEKQMFLKYNLANPDLLEQSDLCMFIDNI